EARRRLGGRILTERPRGWPLPVELGAEFVHGENRELADLAQAAGLLLDRIPSFNLEIAGNGAHLRRSLWTRIERITRQMRRPGPARWVGGFPERRRSLSSSDRRLLTAIVEGYHAAPLERASEHALSTAGQPPSTPEELAQFRVVSGYDGVVRWLASR